jgi:hypothetical protein
MSNLLSSAVEKPKAKRVLKGVHFDFKGAEITYTDWSQGGACSLENDMVLAKAKNDKKPLTKEQQAILDQIGEEHTALDKSKADATNTPSSPATGDDIGGETNDKGTDDMSDQIVKDLQAEIAALRHENAVEKAKGTLAGYGFEAELTGEVADVLAGIEASETIVKAFDALVAQAEAKVEKAVEKANQEAKDSKETADTDLQKALDAEAGEGGEPEADNVEKSLIDKIMEQQDLQKGAK